MRIHKKKWSKKLNKRELNQAFYAIAKGNKKLWSSETKLPEKISWEHPLDDI